MCLKIDLLIKDLKTQIDILEQYKQSIVAETVTKGLNNNKDIRETGVPYIGAAPASWKLHPSTIILQREKIRIASERNVTYYP